MAVSIEDARVSDALPNLEVLVGTYEEFNLGFRLTKNPDGVSDYYMCFSLFVYLTLYQLLGIKFCPQLYQS